MNILHLIPSFYPAYVYGGVMESNYQLCCQLAQDGCVVRVLTTDANGPDSVLDVKKDREVRLARDLSVRYCTRQMRHSVSSELLRLLPSYIRWADVVHLTGAYSFPTIPSLLGCKVLNKPTVWSPRGALQRWQGSTRLLWKTVWEQACRVVAPERLILHATSDEEAIASVERFPNWETVVIPNGVGIPEIPTHVYKSGVLRLLYLGRLHPIKGIENLLAACKLLNGNSGVTWSLTIAGAGDPRYAETIQARIKNFGLLDQVKMTGEIAGQAKQQLFANSDLTVVPSYTESFGMVVAEALAHSIPVIASKGTPWRRLEEVGCGFWVDNDPDSLAGAIKRTAGLPLRAMGQRGREWMIKEFSCKTRALEMLTCYRALLPHIRILKENRE